MPYFWQLAINPKLQNSIISFGYVDSYAKICLFLYPPLENSTTRIAIMEGKEEDLEKITPMTFEENCIMTLDSAKWASHIAKVSLNFVQKFPT